jgi:TusA-related sulfurtransferase
MSADLPAAMPSDPPAATDLDTRGLTCPLPILKAKKALATLASGNLLRVVSTDPGSMRDFAAFARQTGHTLVEQTEVSTPSGAEFVHLLKRR